MASKKKPTAAQLAARAKFTAMVKAKAAARKKAGSKGIARPKKAGKKIGNPNKKYYIEYFYKGLEHREYFNEIPERAFAKGKYLWVSAKNNIGYPLMHTMTDLPVRTDGKQSKTLDELLSGTHKDTKSHNVNVRVVSGLDKITRKGKKTIVHYSRLNGIVKPTPTIQKLVKNIKSKIEYNNHTEAVLLLAKHLKNKDAIFFLNAIIAKHKSLNYMPQELQKARDYYQKELLNIAKLKLTGANYEAIKNAF
jgi:hypothetical protein